MRQLKYLLLGMAFGVVLVKSQVVSWFRIQEMFRLQSFHMYGIIGSAIVVGMLSVWLIRRSGVRAVTGRRTSGGSPDNKKSWTGGVRVVTGEIITIPKKTFHWGNVIGGLIFGLGWSMTGACPGPLFALVGGGFLVVGVTLLSAIGGTWVYGLIRDRLPH